MSKQSNDLPIGNSYYDNIGLAEYFAEFKNGRFIDKNSGKRIKLKEGAVLRIIAPNHAILKVDAKQHIIKREVVIFNEPERFYFTIRAANGNAYKAIVETFGPLKLVQKGNKIPTLENSKCKVVELTQEFTNIQFAGFQPFEANNFNHAFRKVSRQIRPESSDQGNVYENFRHYTTDRLLGEYRLKNFKYF